MRQSPVKYALTLGGYYGKTKAWRSGASALSNCHLPEQSLNPGGFPMTNKYLLFFGLLSLSLLGVSGCAQQMAKQDSTTSPPPAQASTQQDAGQAKAAAAETTSVQDNTPAPPAGAAGSPTQVAGKDPAAQAAPKAAKAKEPTPKEIAAAAALLPLPSKEIVDTIKTLTHHPRVRYLSRSAQYDYYVGGRIDAKYDIQKNELLVSNDPAEVKDTVTCEYSKNGDMISDKKAMPAQKIEECNKLIKELTTYMAR
jgi:hypothetical protein